MIEQILNQIKKNIEDISPVPSKYTVSRGQQNGFEELIEDVLIDMTIEKLPSPTNFAFKLHYGSHFPDLDIYLNNKTFGVEIKSRQKLEWKTNGNSVLESISSPDYDEIYLLFGAYEHNSQKYHVNYKPYWQVTDDIKVTHSPRFYINMNSANSVFSSKEEYDALRGSSEDTKIAFLQNYLKQETNGTKWYIPPQNDEILPINLSGVDKTIKEQIICEIYILYPNDLIRFKSGGTAKSEYNNAMKYLISTYFYYTPSLRDFFSAGGRVTINNKKQPRIIGNLRDYRNQINNLLENANDEFITLAISIWKKNFTVDKSLTFKELYYSILDQVQSQNSVHLEGLDLSRLLR